MKALIIAAGMGTRLGQGQHKCLTPVHGRPLIEHIFESLAVCGCREAWIVTGWQGGELQRALGEKRCKVKLHFVHNPEFARGNGISVLRGFEAMAPGEDFLLLMSDHLVSADLVHRLWHKRQRDRVASVGLDRDCAGIHDIEDGMKVAVDHSGKVTAISKTLAEYGGIDCGVFACTPAFAAYLRAAVAAGEESLSQACARAAAGGNMGTVDITGLPWHDIDTPDGLAAAEGFYFARLMARGRRIFTAWLAATLGVLLLAAWLLPAGPLSPYSGNDAYVIYDAVIRAEIASRSPEVQALAPRVEVINRTCPDFYVMEHLARGHARWEPSYPLYETSFPAHPAYRLVGQNDWQLDNCTIGLGNITSVADGGYAVLIFTNQGTVASTVRCHVVPSANGDWQVNRERLVVAMWQPMYAPAGE